MTFWRSHRLPLLCVGRCGFLKTSVPQCGVATWQKCGALDDESTGWLKKRGHFVLWLLTLEALIRTAPSLATLNDISFLT